MKRFKATLEYDGTDFAGFQWQHGARTVQGELEAALLKRTGQTVRVTGAGRTDAGVHALGQVISWACETNIPTERMGLALNSVMAKDLVVRDVEETDEAFSARFSASSRVYLYLILNRPVASALWRRYSALVRDPLDVNAMQTAAQFLLGEQDFASLCNQWNAEQTTMRDVLSCQIRQRGPFVLARMEANAFLRGMVRTTMGTLIEVGLGQRAPDTIPALLAARNRKRAGPSAPPQGLCLCKVRYGLRRDYTTTIGAAAALDFTEGTDGEE